MSTDTTPSPVVDESARRATQIALLVVVVATFMVGLDSTMVNVALPRIRDDLGAGSNVQWVVSGYLLGMASAYPASGWIADRFGPRRAISACVLAFAAASLVSAVAWSLPVLVAARIVQGLAGGPISPIGMAVILRVVPLSQRGRALGTWGLAAMMAPALGPTLGGRLVDAISWHWLFIVNLPLAGAALFLALRYLEPSPVAGTKPLDVRGLALGAAGLSFLLVTLSQGGRWGWLSPRVIAFLVVGAGVLTVFTRHELRTAHPALDPRVLRTPQLLAATVIVSLVGSSMLTRVVFVPLQLADVRGYGATRIGLMLAPAAVFSAVGMLLGGRIADRFGPRPPVLTGTALTLAATASMAFWEVGTSDIVRIIVMAVQGLGFSLVAASATVLAMSNVRREDLSQGATWRMLWQQLTGAVAVAGLAGLLEARTPSGAGPKEIQSAHGTLALVVAGYLLIALVLAYRIPRGRPSLPT